MPAKQATVATNPLFRFAVWVTISLTFITGAVWVFVVFNADNPPTKLQERLADACDTIVKMGAGALIGLLGGRAGAPDKIELTDGRSPGSTATKRSSKREAEPTS